MKRELCLQAGLLFKEARVEHDENDERDRAKCSNSLKKGGIGRAKQRRHKADKGDHEGRHAPPRHIRDPRFRVGSGDLGLLGA
jgi:hypothetical protein